MKLSRADIHELAVALADELHSRGLLPAGIGALVQGDTQQFEVPYLTPPDRAERGGGYVYFVRCRVLDGPIKIGHAASVIDRLPTIQNGSPYPIDLLAYFWSADHRVDEDARDAYLSRLAAKELVNDAGRGEVKAAAALFEVAL